jgi:hypothetical protein
MGAYKWGGVPSEADEFGFDPKANWGSVPSDGGLLFGSGLGFFLDFHRILKISRSAVCHERFIY